MKFAKALPGTYLAGAKIGTPVYWARRIIGLEHERMGGKIARLYWKYGNAVLGKAPDNAAVAYRRAAKYAPAGWKAKLGEREAQALEKSASMFEARAEYFENMHTSFFRQDIQETGSSTAEFDEIINRGSRTAVRRKQAFLLGAAAECLLFAAEIYQRFGKAAGVLERAYDDACRAEFILLHNLGFERGEVIYEIGSGFAPIESVTVSDVSGLKRKIEQVMGRGR